MKPNDYFEKLLEIDPLFEPENRFSEPLWSFAHRFQSLQRHWELNKQFLESHSSLLQQVKIDSAEMGDAYSETAEVDLEYFPEYLRLSTLSISLSLIENLLGDLSESIANDRGVTIEFDERHLPYIDKHILWLTRGCGLEVVIPKELRKRLNAIKELRNRFLHRISRDIPEDIQKVIGDMVSSANEGGVGVTDDFVAHAMKDIAELAKKIELAFWAFEDSNNST